jgi:hypothetical protein
MRLTQLPKESLYPVIGTGGSVTKTSGTTRSEARDGCTCSQQHRRWLGQVIDYLVTDLNLHGVAPGDPGLIIFKRGGSRSASNVTPTEWKSTACEPVEKIPNRRRAQTRCPVRTAHLGREANHMRPSTGASGPPIRRKGPDHRPLVA